jgi:hypothetical protein
LAALLVFAPLVAKPCAPLSCLSGGEPSVYAPDPTATVSRPEAELRMRSDKRGMELAAGGHGSPHVEAFLPECPSARPPGVEAARIEIEPETLLVVGARAPPLRPTAS